MKKLFSFFAVMLLCQMMWAQTEIVTSISPKTRYFPSSGLSYLDDPARYFNIQLVNTTGTSMDIFFTIDLSCDFSASGENYYVRTKKDVQPASPLSVGTVPVLVNRMIFDQIIGHLNSSAYETNYDINKMALNSFTLPEGQYRFCLTPYRWDGYNNPNPVQVGETVCYTFSICYTGSAPEFTTPVNGLSAGNFNNSNPANNLLNGNLTDLQNTSDNRQHPMYTSIPLSRTLVFNWTGVISNCLTSNDFDYHLKVVEVKLNQNVQEAIDQNGTINTINLKSKTNYIHDTIANRNFHLVPGHVYAAQVQAVPKSNLASEIVLSNEGKSQIITFVWGDNVPIVQSGDSESSMTSNESNNKEQVIKSIRSPYFVNPGKDKTAIEALTSLISSESANIPADNGNAYVTNVTGNDVPYYQVKKADSLTVNWMPVRGDSVIRVQYTAELYEYSGGPVSENLIGQPLKTKTLEVTTPADFSLQNLTPAGVAANDWKDTLEEGFKYLLHLKANVDYSYTKTTTYTITDYIHNMPVTHDSLTYEVEFGNQQYTSDVVFAWGIDSGALDKVYPPQFTYPVDMSSKPWNDTVWTDLPDVVKHDDFKFTWKAAEGADFGDSVYYKLRVAKLPKGKKPKQVKDTLYFKDGITATSYIDSTLFDSLKTGQQYLAVLEVYIVQKGDTNSHYNLLNKGKSLYATFVLKDPPEFKADLSNKLKCSPDALKDLNKDAITPKATELVDKRLKMGEFPLVVQTVKYDDKKKTYSGDGYVVWHPFGIDVRLKVHFDSIQFNKDYQIIKGTAASTTTDSSLYMSALVNDLGLNEWSNDDINRIASQLGEMDQVKEYYEDFKKYAEKYSKKYGGLLGPIVGGNLATEVLTFPLSVSDKEITGSKNVIYAINDMFFSPETALMGVWAIFAAQDDNYYVPFLANNLCMVQDGFFDKLQKRIDLFMARDYEKKLNDGNVMRFKRSSNFGDPKDGTVISIVEGDLGYISAQIEFDINSNDVLGIDKDGTPRKGKTVHANVYAKFTDWNEWVSKVSIEPFALPDCDRFTFVPTGKGIWFDHSTKETPAVVTLPYEYLFGKPAPKEMTDEEKKKLGKASKEWKGFYWDEVSVLLSDDISNTFISNDTIKKDSMVVYRYGINNTVVDSVHYSYPGRRISFGAKGLILDDFGISTELFGYNLLRAETDKGGGWAFSIDTISLRVTKGKYKEGLIKGGFGLPLFSGGFDYSCSIGSDSLMFGITAKKNPLNFDIWAAVIKFDSASSYFRIQKLYKETNTRIDLNMNGKISISASKIGLSDFDAVKFEHMGMRNYNLSGKPKEGTARTDDFEFDIGHWSFASPQKYIGGHIDEEQKAQGDNPVASVSVGGFTFSVTKFTPIVENQGDDLKLGMKVVGQIKFAPSKKSDMSLTTGFTFWGITEPKKHYHIKEVKGRLDSLELKDIDFEVFKLSGKLHFKYDKATSTNVTGFEGKISVTVMTVVSLTMDAGFGKEKDDKGEEYSWWYFNGACKFPGGIPLGAVSINGFSGGFAFNMKPKLRLDSPSFSAKALLTKAEQNTDPEQFKSSGMEFEPARDNWVANAGISMILTGAENTMNLDGLVSLRIGDGHFTGLFVEANAYILTKVIPGTVPGDDAHNSKPLIKATTILGYERYAEYDYFRISIAAYSELDLGNLLKGISTSTVSDKVISCIHSGTSIIPNSNIEERVNNILEGSVNKDMEEQQANNTLSYGIKIRIPVDFELKYYKKKTGKHNAGNFAWSLSIGKPDYDDRLELEKNLNLVVLKSNSKFTFYLMTGNSFAYTLPELTPEMYNFFYGSKKDKKLDSINATTIRKERMLSTEDWLSVQNGGGFCLGSTFHAEAGFNCFLYAEGSLDLGFDVALLNVGGMGCPGYPQIGKHNFYAIGKAYAALQCDVGLKINLGFWKGKISIFKAGVGALLQAGGPNPAYCYGLLRFQVSLVNNLVNFSTSVDMAIGDVCVPGAGDPLANVKLFQNVTPGFASQTTAKSGSNLQTPLQLGIIVSNMPWDRDVMLANNDGSNARKFRFVLVEKDCKYYTMPNKTFVETDGVEKIKFTKSRSDENVFLFEAEQGGFVENTFNKIELHARAFEWRTPYIKTGGKNSHVTLPKGQNTDVSYNVTGVKKGTVLSTSPKAGTYAWFDPTWEEDNGKITVKPFKADTILYFKTKLLGYTMDNGVAFSWPYNGEKQFFCKEYVHSGSTPYANLYLFARRDDVFDKSKLSSAGKELKIFLLRVGEEDNDVDECSYTYYPSGSLPYVKVKLPNQEYTGAVGPRKLKFFVVDKDKYKSAEEAANKAMGITQKKAETQSRIASSTYTAAENAHKSNKNSNTINIKNQQLEEIYDSKHTDGTDSMTFYRVKMKQNYKICANVGEHIYDWTWFVNGNDNTNGDYIKRHFSSYGKTDLDYLGQNIFHTKLSQYSDYIQLKPDYTKSDYYMAMYNYGWVFASYDPNDSKRYHSGCVMPPIAFIVMNRDANTPLLQMHKKYFQYFIDLNRDFKKTNLITTRYSPDKGGYDYKKNGTTTVTGGLKTELTNILKYGLIENTTTDFKHIDGRIKGGTSYTLCTKANYNPTTWDVPCILDVVYCNRQPMEEKWFQGEYASRFALGRDEYRYWYIKDYASNAIASDIRMIHDFMQSNVFHVGRYGNRGWSHKVDYFKNYYSASGKNTFFRYGNAANAAFPYDMPEIYIVTHYMAALDNLHGTKSYTTAGGTSITLYEKDNEFIYVSDLNSLQHQFLAKYWWNAAGQSLDYSDKGFANNFYWKSSNTKYYNIKTNQADKGKQKTSTAQSAVLGEWYTKDWSKSFGSNITNYFQVYYITSQSPNFETNLMNMAVAVRAHTSPGDNTRVFYPNAIISTNKIYYNIPNGGNTPVPAAISHSAKLYMGNPDSNGGSLYGF